MHGDLGYFLVDPVYGYYGWILRTVGIFSGNLLGSAATALPTLVLIDIWQWTPLIILIVSAGLASLPQDIMEASKIDGATYLQRLWYLYIPHLGRSVAVVVMIELIFLLSVFAEIYTTTGGGPGDASTNMAFLIFKQALLNFDAGVASAGALFAVVLANIAAAFMIRMVGKNLDK